MNAFLENGNGIVWLAALLALLLLAGVSFVAEVFMSRRRDLSIRLLRTTVGILVPALALAPGLTRMAYDENLLSGLALLVFAVFFALFCYYLGKRVGTEQGRKRISDLVGLDSADNITDAQDRLFESRMRFPNPADVIKSIGEMAKANEAERLEKERAAVRELKDKQTASAADMDDVEVVEID